MALSRDHVFTLARQIPRGRVSTYSDLAHASGHPRAARQVGWALSLIPDGLDVPWWRVIKSDGRVPFHGHRELQMELLRSEGVPVDESGRVALERFHWDEFQADPDAGP